MRIAMMDELDAVRDLSRQRPSNYDQRFNSSLPLGLRPQAAPHRWSCSDGVDLEIKVLRPREMSKRMLEEAELTPPNFRWRTK